MTDQRPAAAADTTVTGAVELAVVLLNFRTPHLVLDCVRSLCAGTSKMNAGRVAVAVVDNASGDDSVAVISDWIDTEVAPFDIQLVSATTNAGFAAGINAGICAMAASSYLLMNSDTLARPGAIDALLSLLKAEPSVGVFAPQLEWPSGEPQESCFRFISPQSEFLGAASFGVLDRLLPSARVAMDLSAVRAGAEPDWASFAVILIRKSVIDDVGLLDEGFFMYFEDAEFCARARKVGWRIAYRPEARFVHLRGGSSSVKSRTAEKQRLPRYYYQARTRYFFKKYGVFGPLLANIVWTLGRLLSAPRQWLGRADKRVPKSQWRDIWIPCFTPMAPYTHPEQANDAP